MKDEVIFKSDLKPLRLKQITEHKKNGGSFPEIAALMNKRKQFTLYGKKWTGNYMYRFFTENQ